MVWTSKGQEEHIKFLSIRFLRPPPHRKSHNLGPQKKVDVPLFLGKSTKRGPTQFFFSGEFVRAACLQNETAPEKLLNRYEKRFEKPEKDPKNDLKRV